jgi:hypothetical protein
MDLQTLLQLSPEFHQDEHGRSVSWAIGDDVLQFISDHVRPGSWTMETGSGMSTVVFAWSGCRHYSIAPWHDEFEKIRSFCHKHEIDLENTTLKEGFSETTLPALMATSRLDFFLVDGRHAFPTPYIDWYYGARMLRIGGLMTIDDTQLLTGAVLADFMREDNFWREVEVFDKTAVFEKLNDEFHSVEWNQQPYILNRQ